MNLLDLESDTIFMLLLLATVFKLALNRIYLIQKNHLDQGLKFPLWNLDFWIYSVQGIWRIWYKEKNEKIYTEVMRYIVNASNILFLIILLLGTVAICYNLLAKN